MRPENITPGGNVYWHRPDGTVEMKLTQGKTCILDERDLGDVAGLRWRAVRNHDRFYAVAHAYRDDGIRRVVGMHTLLIGHHWAGKGVHVDHEDGNGLNNQRSNIRDATPANNAANTKKNTRNTTGYKGVSINPACRIRPYRALVQKGGKKVYSAQFASALEAAIAYNREALVHFGEFARLNLL